MRNVCEKEKKIFHEVFGKFEMNLFGTHNFVYLLRIPYQVDNIRNT